MTSLKQPAIQIEATHLVIFHDQEDNITRIPVTEDVRTK